MSSTMSMSMSSFAFVAFATILIKLLVILIGAYTVVVHSVVAIGIIHC